jgi:sigma-B regulation protein RsbU (phosphoserine phosphatase)
LTPDLESRAQLLADVINLITGTSFLMFGMVAFVVAAIRRRASGVRAIVLLGIWTIIYGSQAFNYNSLLLALEPHWLVVGAHYMRAATTYLTLVAGLVTFRELSLGFLRKVLGAMAIGAGVIAVLGFGKFVVTHEEYWLLTYNEILATVSLLFWLPFLISPKFARKYSVLRDRGVLLVGYAIFALEALIANFVRPFGYQSSRVFDDLGFGAFILAIGYVAMKGVYASERRLSAIENELAIARQLQFSILPTTTPDIRSLRIAAVYEPMTAVAGDFYEFLPIDDYRAGFLIADVSGHGVPAALIASMINVAAQSVITDAADPSTLLTRLEGMLSGQLRGQFISVAYLYIDAEIRVARYSAAGHPPLLFWCAACNAIARIESNGPLFGAPCEPVFPTREIPFAAGDRFLLYTDGFSEPENTAGEPFVHGRVAQILYDNPSRAAAELSCLFLNEIRAWVPPGTQQQDDITFLLIDVI